MKPFSEHSNGTEHGSGAGVLHRLLDELRSLLNEFKSESFLNHSQVMNTSQYNFLVINSNLYFDFSFPFKVLRLRGFIRTSAMVALILCSSSCTSFVSCIRIPLSAPKWLKTMNARGSRSCKPQLPHPMPNRPASGELTSAWSAPTMLSRYKLFFGFSH